MSTDTSHSADDPAPQTESEDIEAEHRRAQESGEVFEGEHPDSQ